MKKKFLPFLLVLAAIMSVTFAAQAEDVIGPFFFMRIESNAAGTVKDGEQFTADIYGGLLEQGNHRMGAFQFTLKYPKDQLKLVKLEAAGNFKYGGVFKSSLETGTISYNSDNAGGKSLSAGRGTKLATATFEVLPSAKTGTVTIGTENEEIVRIQDSVSTLGRTEGGVTVNIYRAPTMTAELSEGGKLQVRFHKNPAGTLIAAVYDGEGRMICSRVQAGVPENAEMQEIDLSTSGGKIIRVFLIDSEEWYPLCEAAQTELR